MTTIDGRARAIVRAVRRRRSLSVAVGLGVVAGLAAAVSLPSACGSPSFDAPGDVGDAATEASRRAPGGSSSGAQTDGAAAAPSLSELVQNDAIWTALPNGGSCGLREGKVVPDPFPRRTWVSCGQGCRTSKAALQFDEPVAVERHASAGAYVSGDVFLQFELLSKSARIGHIARLSDGATVAATLDRSPGQNYCILRGAAAAAPLLFFFYDGTGSLFGRAAPEPGTPIAWHGSWLLDWPLITRDRFAFDDGYGTGGAGDVVYLFESAAATEPKELPGHGNIVRADKNQVLWASSSSGGVRSYTKAGGPVVLVPMTTRVAPGAALSDDRIIWLSAKQEGERTSDNRLHWSPRTADPAKIVVHDGPSAPFTAGILDIHAGGEWAAVYGAAVGSLGGIFSLLVWNTATGESWTVPNRPGHTWARLLALSPTEIVLADVLDGTDNRYVIHDLVRIDLSAVAALAAAWK